MEIQKDLLIAACADMDITLSFDYSGRFMYGESCVGIVGSPRDLMRFVLDVIPVVDPSFEVGTRAHNGEVPYVDHDEAWLEMRSDNMGLDMIYYWPDVSVTE